jgi:hypothetical protein
MPKRATPIVLSEKEQGRIALLVFPRMFIAQTLGSGTALFGSKSFLNEWITGL